MIKNNNRINTIVMFSILVMGSMGLLTGCGNKDKNTETVTTAATTEAALDLSGVYAYYADQLQQYKPAEEEDGMTPSFLLFDENGDEIPKLYIGEGQTDKWGQFIATEIYADVNTPLTMRSACYIQDEWEVSQYQLQDKALVDICWKGHN